MRKDRGAFVEFFGGDGLVLPPAGAEERLNAYYRHRQEAALARQPSRRRPPNLLGVDAPAFEFSPELANAGTIGMIYAETDRLNFYNEYGMLRTLFAERALAADKRYADALRGYLRPETIGPLPVPPPGRRPPGHGRCGVPEGPAKAEIHLGRARRGPDASAKALVLRARVRSRHLRDRRAPQRAPAPVDNGRTWTSPTGNGDARARL